MFNNKEIRWPVVKLAGNATTLDSIGWTGLIAPIVTYLLLPVIKKGNRWMIILCYTLLFYALFAISPWVIQAFDWLSKESYAHNMGLLGDIFGKVCYGRFKIAQTSAFAVAGSMFGCLIHHQASIGFMAWVSSAYFVIGVAVFVIWLLIDSSFLMDIVSENVPLPAHMLSFGCITAFTFIHCYFVDGDRPVEKKYKSRKRCTFQFRLGMVSLTVFCVGGWVARQLALPLRGALRPAVPARPAQAALERVGVSAVHRLRPGGLAAHFLPLGEGGLQAQSGVHPRIHAGEDGG